MKESIVEFATEGYKASICRDPNFFGDTFPSFRKSDMNMLRLYSIGSPDGIVRKDISKSFGTHEEFLCELYDECTMNTSKSSKEFLEDSARQYFKDAGKEGRERIYWKFIEDDEGKRATYFEEADREFDESLDILRDAAEEEDAEWMLDYMLNLLEADDWKEPAILDLAQAAREQDFDEFSERSEDKQIDILIENCMDNPEVHRYIYDSLIKYIDEKYMVVLFDVDVDELIGTWIHYDLWDPDFEEFQFVSTQTILVANKELYAKRWFGFWRWDDSCEEEVMEYLAKTFECYCAFLNGDVYEARLYRDDELMFLEGYYGSLKKVIKELNEDIEENPTLKEFSLKIEFE